MKEINIADVLAKKRKEKHVTQDELAAYIGVSKASVSKWETGQSYPDVTFLPLLASYFDISVDELLDYKPQMPKEQIKKLYRRLSSDFTVKPYGEVLAECRGVIKKYYSCFPLLLQMGILMINHVELLKNDPQQTASLITEAGALFTRVKEESGDLALQKKALFMEAYCRLISGDASSALELLDGANEAAMPPELIMASAYSMTGRTEEAKAVLQSGIYQNIVVLFNFFPAYLPLCVDDPVRFGEVLRRAEIVAETFDMRHLHPGVLCGLYLSAAQGYAAQGQTEQALGMLQKYADLVTGDIYPLRLHGDAFFDHLNGWFDNLDIGNSLPRDEKTIRKSMAGAVADNPAFSALAGEPRFLSITEKLKKNSEKTEG